MVDLIVLNFYFDLVLPFYFLKWNRHFSACERKLAKYFVSFLKAQVSFSSNFASTCSAMPLNITALYFFNSDIICLIKNSSLKCIFLRLLSARINIRQIPDVNFGLTSQVLFKFCIILHCHDKELLCKF